MTRFARAKGSKASNEKLPEEATSWSEMKQELLNKNKEIEEQRGRQEALKQRQANYQAFLQEKEEEEDRQIAWADFPEANTNGSTPNHNNKRKVSENPNINSKKLKSLNNDSEDSDDGQFAALKSQIDKALAKQAVDSDSDEAPEEASTKQKPEEIVVKKAKNIKSKLKIVVDKETTKNPSKSEPEVKETDKVLSEKDQRLIAKKQARHKKQVEKKKLIKQQKRNGNPSNEAPKEVKTETREEIEAAKLERKLARRERQKEKRRLGRMQKSEANKPKLTEEELKKIEKKKEKKIKQIEKRQKFKEAKALETEAAKKTAEVVEGENMNFNASFNVNKKFTNNKNSNADNTTSNTTTKNNKNFNANKKVNDEKKFSDNDNFNADRTYPDKKNFNAVNMKFNENKTMNGQEPKQKPFQQPQTNPNKKAKPKDNKDRSSRKQKPEIMYINGKTVDVDYIDGFPVKKDDADRLRQLRKEMISKGLPRSEINAALKLERRRAEKAFAREKKNVCFNCRKSGHNLSECPELDKDQSLAQTAGTGICFKCGSTEHTHFECKVVKGMDYKFATCFICKEQGHISRQCPDNQRGLYPKGGSCKVCGDVTHLKKDCPKYQAQQAQLQSSLSIGTMDNGNPDDFDGPKAPNNTAGFVRRPNKVVKF